MSEVNLKLLAKKFPEQDIEWRVQQCGQGKNGPWALIIPYITNRAIMQRLDDVVGAGKWKNEFTASPCGTGYMCGISIKVYDEWVTRWDGSEKTGNGSIDQVKSTMSSAMKRTGVQWGIGRYLYQFDAEFADAKTCDNRYNVLPGYKHQESKDKKTNHKFGFQWKAKPLAAWALPVTDNEINNYIKAMSNCTSNEELKMIFGGAYKLAISEGDDKLLEKFTEVKDKTKGKISSNNKDDENEKQILIDTMVNKHISIINSSINESSINGMSEMAMTELKASSRGEQLNSAMKSIKEATFNKLNEIRG